MAAAVTLVAAACSGDGGDSPNGSSSRDGSGGSAQDAGERHEGAPPVPESCDESSPEAAEGSAPDPEVVAAIEERGKPDPAAVIAEVGDSTEPVDLVDGIGEEVNLDGSVQVQYSLINPADESVLETSWADGALEATALSVPVEGRFPGFADAMEGMREGGRRAWRLSVGDLLGDEPIPPEAGLSADDSVLFVVDLMSVSAEVPEQPGSVEADEQAREAAEKRGAPDVSVPEGTKDTDELIWIDDVVGEGEVVCPGDSVLAHYTGIQASNGEKFDSSWDRGKPSNFSLDRVIKGWTDGLVGMKVGGRRTLVVPADQAYGEESSDGGPSGVLVFTIDLVGVS